MKFVLWFSEINKDDTALVGGKGANLGEMVGLGMPVPPGFVITAQAYKLFLSANQLAPQIKKVLSGLDVNNPVQLDDASKRIKHLISRSPVPEEISQAIISAYFDLTKQLHRKKSPFSRLKEIFSDQQALVAVRSSATSEDSKEASFAGQNQTFLNIVGEANLVNAVRECWASLFEARSIFYRVQNHFDHFNSYIAVVVQTQIPSEISGVLFSIDPVTNNHQRIVVETVWGLGEYIVQGKVTPDHYEIDKDDLTIVEKKTVSQKIMLVRSETGGVKQLPTPKSKIEKQKIPDNLIRELASLSLALEKHYYFPQDSEFAVFNNKIYIVQTRPITTVAKTSENKDISPSQRLAEHKLELLLTGAPASPGLKSGVVRVLKNSQEINLLKTGEVLVTSQTNPDFVPAMKKASAIITDKGGRTSHAAIVSRELGIPCVVGTAHATTVLKDGLTVSVDGTEGKVYRGFSLVPANQTTSTKVPMHPKTEPDKVLTTATKVYVNLAEPDEAKEIAARNCDGVGLLRAEFMLAGIGIHPKKALAQGRQPEFIKSLTDQLTTFAQAFYPRPIVYRATDFKTNEYRSLKGGAEYEPEEPNPMLGFRGAYRYIVQPEVFRLEIEAIKNVREKAGFKNLWLMIPFCRTIDELLKVRELLHKNGLQRSPSFKLWLMCEIPSNVILLDKFIEQGIDGISIGSNDLTMLTLGIDRDNENVAGEFNEQDPAMMFSFYKIIKTCRKYNVTCSMCGQAPSDYPELTEKLVKWGITSVSVNPDVLDRTRQVVASAEKKLLQA